jgi:hypothetical protein
MRALIAEDNAANRKLPAPLLSPRGRMDMVRTEEAYG